MTRYLTLDHAYDAAFSNLPHANHEEWFSKAVFGTSDFLDVALRATGHEAKTLVQNFYPSQASMIADGIVFEPDVVLSREPGRFPAGYLQSQFPHAKIVCTCSHRVDDIMVLGHDLIFTSFPWFVDHVRSLGIRCEYLPLAFGKPVLDRVKYDGQRDIPVCFIGGLGMRTWKSGTETMAAIAEQVPSFEWRGYWQGDESEIPPALQRARKPTVYGAEMYRILMRTKIALNRHGEIAARGPGGLFGNNCRQYEATGCGCCLLTDHPGEFTGGKHCIQYESANEAVTRIHGLLDDSERIYTFGSPSEIVAEWGVTNTLANHTYESSVPQFISVVESL